VRLIPITGVLLSLLIAPARAAAPADPPPLEISIAARALHPGELVVVGLTPDPQTADARVTLFDRSTPAFKTADGAWQALVGIDLDQAPGEFLLTAEARSEGTVRSGGKRLIIDAKEFATRTLRVAPAFAVPPPAARERIERESLFLEAVFASPAPQRLWQVPFVRPVDDAANSAFGARTILNGLRGTPHGGVDFSSRPGTPIKAPNAGQVVTARELFYTGNTIIIDHGLGMFSTLAHLSEIQVREGELVLAGHVVGLVGATGRVTGPHLHWGLRIAGARVDPLSALALLGGQHTSLTR
jgi:murein DD-endopeptidase MepM/ murein hydrolase activator NlpD